LPAFSQRCRTIIKWGGDKVWNCWKLSLMSLAPAHFGIYQENRRGPQKHSEKSLPFVGNLGMRQARFSKFAGNFLAISKPA